MNITIVLKYFRKHASLVHLREDYGVQNFNFKSVWVLNAGKAISLIASV